MGSSTALTSMSSTTIIAKSPRIRSIAIRGLVRQLVTAPNFPTLDYEFITTQYRSIDNVRYHQPAFHPDLQSKNSFCKLKTYPKHFNCVVVIAAFYIDPKINELASAENFPSRDYEFITTSHPYTGVYYDKREKHWERYMQHERDLYPINSKLLKCPYCKVLIAVYNLDYYHTPWIYSIPSVHYWISRLTHVPCNPSTSTSTHQTHYSIPIGYKRHHSQCD